jgi:N4-(beta-N-acetylglucosaminyl)-L-asparaginase
MINRRKFIALSALSSATAVFAKKLSAASSADFKNGPVVISTWDAGIEANKGAWKILSAGGRALDAVEAGVTVTEASQSCCVGLNAYPDRDGIVTLDACIMDESFNCGSVAFLERIKHPISVARRVMEKTPHVMLAGKGAQQFAILEGFPLEEEKLSLDAQKAYDKWLEKSEYKPIINIESLPVRQAGKKEHGPFAPGQLESSQFNHDTIGMVAMDAKGNLSGSCTTSGLAFKMRGRVGDSPIIGAGLYVDNEVGACTATGTGEEVIRIVGSHTVVELMRQGLSPEAACKKAIERIIKIKKEKVKDIQVAFLALNKKGEAGAFAIQKGFSYAIKNATMENLIPARSWFE